MGGSSGKNLPEEYSLEAKGSGNCSLIESLIRITVHSTHFRKIVPCRMEIVGFSGKDPSSSSVLTANCANWGWTEKKLLKSRLNLAKKELKRNLRGRGRERLRDKSEGGRIEECGGNKM